MLALDSLVTDLMFQKDADLDPEMLLDALGGEDVVANRKIIDPDMQDPRFEMELSPSMPFRQHGERRLMIIDDSVAPMRKNPRSELVVPVDLREEKDRLIAICEAVPIRLGRLFALGSWGDAVLVARSARDLRAIALLHWVLDPTLDVDGTKRASRGSTADIEAKLAAYEKRLEELDDNQIIAGIKGARMERRGELLIVDVLEDDGTWDLRRSFVLEQSLAGLDRFSMIPGAPASQPEARPAAREATREAAKPAPAKPSRAKPAAPLSAADLGSRMLLLFPAERFDLDMAAALGKRDYDAILDRDDDITGAHRDRIYREGAEFAAPLEFLSEVFVDGKPLAKPQFEQGATALGAGARAMDVHCPRFGPVTLIDIEGRGRFITSARAHAAEVLALLQR